MSAADLAIVLVTVVAIAALVVLVASAAVLLRALRELRRTLEEVEAQAVPLLTELRDTVRDAGAEVERVDELLDTAASIQKTVDHASRLTYVAFSNPLIKVVAFFRGLGRGIGRMFGVGRRARKAERRRDERKRKAA